MRRTAAGQPTETSRGGPEVSPTAIGQMTEDLLANYRAVQYQYLQFLSEHLADCSRSFGGDFDQVVILAVLGQRFLGATGQGVKGPAATAEMIWMPAMRVAVRLYRELGFHEAPAYYQTPIEGTMFLALDLENWSEVEFRRENLSHLFDFNRAWARKMQEVDPDYFNKLAKLQTPQLLWIGCSDSRVPANEIVGLLPGEVFVHRNVANVVVHTDLNCLSVIQFAVDVLKVEHILVVGHYGCGGVHAALTNARVGLADNWIRHVGDVSTKHAQLLLDAGDEPLQHDRLCELNALEQVANVCQTTIVRDAWARGQVLSVHGWVYTLRDGRVHDLGLNVAASDQLETQYATALAAISVDKEDR